MKLELESGIVDFLFRSFQRRGAETQSAQSFLWLPTAGAGVRGQGLGGSSWSLELELESGGLGVRGQYAGVRGQ